MFLRGHWLRTDCVRGTAGSAVALCQRSRQCCRTELLGGMLRETNGQVSLMAGESEVRRRLARVAWLLDNSIRIPGSKFRIGLDAILGLIPGIGDVLGVLLSSYIVREAARLGAPPSVLLRMAFNVAVEGIVGIVPFVGDVFDAAWK